MLTVLGANGPSGGFRIANSLRFRSSASAYLNRTPSVAGNQKTWTWSGWVKRGEISNSVTYEIFSGDNGSTSFTGIRIVNNTIYVQDYLVSTKNIWWQTAAVFRDPSAWYHIVVKYDTTQASLTSSVLVYVNGVSQSLTFTAATGAYVQNYNGIVNSTYSQKIANKSTLYFDGYMAEINFIDGQALTPSSFGEIDAVTGVWKPKQYAGTYGTNGFYLNFSNGTSTTTLGYDSSSNGNNWTTNNISLTTGSTYDWMIDSPTSYAGTSYGVGNYAVLNPISNLSTGSTITNGNLQVETVSSGDCSIPSTIGMIDGKYYAEFIVTSSALSAMFGLIPANYATGTAVGYNANSVGLKSSGDLRNKGISTGGWSTTWTTNDVMAIAFDASAGTVDFYKNNVKQNSTLTGFTSGPYFFAVSDDGSAISETWIANFGQRSFAYTPPSGYKSLCTQNLPAASIVDGSKYMAATTYTGTGSSLSVTNSGAFQPDFVWIKSRSAATDHALYDVIRGTQNRLESNTTDAAVASDNGLTAFGSSGFTVNTLAQVNTSAATYVGWQWKAGGTAVTNTAGSITSSVSANTTAGFSVVTYTTPSSGTSTVGHGLGIAPSLIILKGRALVTNWSVYHASVGNTGRLVLNTTAVTDTNVVYWNNTSPTSSVFTLGTNYADSSTYVAYCFAAIPGYSAFGSYTGNGSADGPFVYCGFRPRFVMIKRTDSTGYDWPMRDAARSPYNEVKNTLLANSSNAEATNNLQTDFLSNGFKLRDTGGNGNASGGTYIYAAFAENPFQNALAR